MAKQRNAMKHVMTGISYMIPIVVAGGILGALAKAFGGWNIGSAVEAGATPFSNLNPFTWVGFWWGVNKLSSYAMDFAVAVMTAGVSYSIAGRPGIVPGLVIGYCSAQSKAGFLGGLLMAFIIGWFVNWMKTWKLPKKRFCLFITTEIYEHRSFMKFCQTDLCRRYRILYRLRSHEKTTLMTENCSGKA